nr:PREDICTED: T-cell surface glycoprotein CD3 epsilon chain [Latimeria chalumnae]|eukprot:XP_005988210.1 PREDICTED: T-cell surface glycoprotein CD3 epsilon chain [Latimeria chalumnae]
MRQTVLLCAAVFTIAFLGVSKTQETEGEDQNQEKPTVEVSGTTVTLTCPTDYIKWKKDDKELPKELSEANKLEIKNFNDDNNGYYGCSKESSNHTIYVKAKVCENCVKLDVMALVGIIVADLMITFGVILTVYYCTKNRKGRGAPAATPNRPKAYNKPRKEDRPPPIPNPDYEPIRRGQRDVYSDLKKY